MLREKTKDGEWDAATSGGATLLMNSDSKHMTSSRTSRPRQDSLRSKRMGAEGQTLRQRIPCIMCFSGLSVLRLRSRTLVTDVVRIWLVTKRAGQTHRVLQDQAFDATYRPLNANPSSHRPPQASDVRNRVAPGQVFDAQKRSCLSKSRRSGPTF